MVATAKKATLTPEKQKLKAEQAIADHEAELESLEAELVEAQTETELGKTRQARQVASLKAAGLVGEIEAFRRRRRVLDEQLRQAQIAYLVAGPLTDALALAQQRPGKQKAVLARREAAQAELKAAEAAFGDFKRWDAAQNAAERDAREDLHKLGVSEPMINQHIETIYREFEKERKSK